MDRVLRASLPSFGINLMFVLGLHVLPPLAFMCPAATGFVAGWRMRVTFREGLAFGAAMGGWMTLLCAVIAVPVMLFLPTVDMRFFWLVALIPIVHIGAFAGAGAMFGGHFARREAPVG